MSSYSQNSPQTAQPGKTWVVCQDEDGKVNITIILGFGNVKN